MNENAVLLQLLQEWRDPVLPEQCCHPLAWFSGPIRKVGSFPTLFFWPNIGFDVTGCSLVLRIRLFIPDPGSTYFHPGSRIRIFSILHPGSASKNLSILTQERWFLSSRKYDLGCSSRIRIPNPDPDFLPIPDPGAKKAPDPGSRGQKAPDSGSATLLLTFLLFYPPRFSYLAEI